MKAVPPILRRVFRQGETATSVVQVVLLRSVVLVINLCTGLLTAALLGPSGRGEQAALVVMPQFLAALSSLGLHASLIYNVKADPEHEREYLGTSLVLTLAASSLAAFVTWQIEPVLLAQYDPHVIAYGRCFLLVTPVIALTWQLSAILEARSLFSFANKMLFVSNCATLIGLLGLLQFDRLTPVTAATAYLIPQVLTFAYMAVFVWSRVLPTLSLQAPYSHRLLHYGLRFYGVDLLGTLSGYMDQLVIVFLLSPSAVGLYMVSLSTSRILNIVQQAVSTVLFATVAARQKSRVVETVAAAVRITSAINVAAALALGLVGPSLIVSFYGNDFAGSVRPFKILLFETIISNATRLLYQSYSGTGRPGIVTVIEAIGVSVSILAMLALIPLYGTVGAALSVLAASTVRVVCVLGALRLILKVRIPQLVLQRSDITRVTSRW